MAERLPNLSEKSIEPIVRRFRCVRSDDSIVVLNEPVGLFCQHGTHVLWAVLDAGNLLPDGTPLLDDRSARVGFEGGPQLSRLLVELAV